MLKFVGLYTKDTNFGRRVVIVVRVVVAGQSELGSDQQQKADQRRAPAVLSLSNSCLCHVRDPPRGGGILTLLVLVTQSFDRLQQGLFHGPRMSPRKLK